MGNTPQMVELNRGYLSHTSYVCSLTSFRQAVSHLLKLLLWSTQHRRTPGVQQETGTLEITSSSHWEEFRGDYQRICHKRVEEAIWAGTQTRRASRQFREQCCPTQVAAWRGRGKERGQALEQNHSLCLDPGSQKYWKQEPHLKIKQAQNYTFCHWVNYQNTNIGFKFWNLRFLSSGYCRIKIILLLLHPTQLFIKNLNWKPVKFKVGL